MYTTLLVVDDDLDVADLPANTLSFEDYLRDYPKLHEKRIRIINLCDTRRYLSQGYYCSLLAEARRHDVLPSVRVINTLRNGDEQGIWIKAERVDQEIFRDEKPVRALICMGEVQDFRLKTLAATVFQQYPVPLLEVTLSADQGNVLILVQRIGLAQLNAEERHFCWQVLGEYARIRWRKQSSRKKYRWELAMLVNPQEASRPSNQAAVSRFIRAGRRLGMQVDVVTADEISQINQYDGLFIRETTAIDHHTYRLACEAEQNGLVVLDDPDSILRCCNKVFLHDAFHYQKVPSLKTLVVNRADPGTLDQLERELGYPMVLKLPEGSFSRGVFKVDNREALIDKLRSLFKNSALVLAQEYLYTDYDWRIGVLNGRALYACRYYMARNHWQIYNHGVKRHTSGNFDTLPTFETPRSVLNAALKAAAVVGKGLYGIDIKLKDNHAYVIEVNDNPNIDQGIEDKYLGEELYMQIMSEFLRRLELRGAH
ncbi:RimK family protein [Microbulbifer sp. CnH-101-G]|uniref:RimK family protein n=1 Tax=Microbulbifer sp. CnH-101-G TaxID=3243393 RepID=UPI00403A726F